MDKREVSGNARCPCESGKRYAKCCKKKRLKWLVASDGTFYKSIPLTKDATELVNKAEADYWRVFGRAPNKASDPLLLTKYLVSEDELARQCVEAMRVAGVRPEIIYAYQKTGLILTEQNLDLATTRDVDEWDDAIDEYFEQQEHPPEPSPTELLFNSLEDEFDSCIICLGYAIDQGVTEEGTPSSSSLFSVDDYVLLCASKSIKTLRSIKALINEDIGADCLALTRHIYENYLHIVFAINRPDMLEHVVDAVVGLKDGSCEYEVSSTGKVNSRKIIRKSDGAVFQGQISAYKMAESSHHAKDVELFDYLYSFLSDYTHPSFVSLQLVVGDKGCLDPLSNELQGEATFFSICFSAMVLDELRLLRCISLDVKEDIKVITHRVACKANLLLRSMYETNAIPDHYELFCNRLLELGN